MFWVAFLKHFHNIDFIKVKLTLLSKITFTIPEQRYSDLSSFEDCQPDMRLLFISSLKSPRNAEFSFLSSCYWMFCSFCFSAWRRKEDYGPWTATWSNLFRDVYLSSTAQMQARSSAATKRRATKHQQSPDFNRRRHPTLVETSKQF